jgi:hypothetical protein
MGRGAIQWPGQRIASHVYFRAAACAVRPMLSQYAKTFARKMASGEFP